MDRTKNLWGAITETKSASPYGIIYKINQEDSENSMYVCCDLYGKYEFVDLKNISNDSDLDFIKSIIRTDKHIQLMNSYCSTNMDKEFYYISPRGQLRKSKCSQENQWSDIMEFEDGVKAKFNEVFESLEEVKIYYDSQIKKFINKED